MNVTLITLNGVKGHSMDNNAKIIYTGETDVAFSRGYLSMTLRSEWFFSKDKKCYGIPVSFKCVDTTGEIFDH